MRTKTSRQLAVFGVLLALDALLIVTSLAVFPQEQLTLTETAPAPMQGIPPWLLGLANAGIVLVLYGLLGLAGFWLARRLGMPGIFRTGAGWRAWAVRPMLIGLGLGLVIVVIDRLFVAIGPGWEGFSHPAFPLSILASATAGIGEEILFRLFVLSLWAFLLNLVLGRLGATGVALWVGNLISAIAFGAGHLPAAMLLVGATTPAEIPPLVLAELFLLNGSLGLVAGQQFLRVGLVAAAGVHFWADIVWHVIWPTVQSLG